MTINVDLLATTDKDDEAKRDHLGRYLIVPPGQTKAVAYTRATTIAKTLDDTTTLEAWKLRTATCGYNVRPDLLALAATTTDNKTLKKICQEALDAGGASNRSNIGTALHTATEQIDRGGKPTLTGYDDQLNTYSRTLADNGIEIIPRYIEKIVVNHQHKIAGTFDRIVKLPTGELVIADLKTGTNLDYSWASIAIQLAIYANADAIYNPATGIETALPDDLAKTIGLVIHLPADRNECTLYLVDLIEGWARLQLALQVRDSRKGTNKLAHTYRPDLTKPAAATTRAALYERIELLRNEYPEALPILAGLWPENIPTLKAHATHTHHELVAISKVVELVEANQGVPF